MEVLTIKELAPYLPYGLKCIYEEKPNKVYVLVGLHSPYKTIDKCFARCELRVDKSTQLQSHVFNVPEPSLHLRPLLRPLSQLTQEIEHNGQKVDVLEELKLFKESVSGNKIVNYRTGNQIPIGCLEYARVQTLLKYHFDVFGLIEKGLAIEKQN